MSAGITKTDGMFYFGDTPWHGLGTELKELATAQQAIAAAGLEWTVSKHPLAWGILKERSDGKGGVEDHIENWQRAKGRFAMIRDDNNAFLGTVRGVYQPLQNIEAFNFMDSLVEGEKVLYHTAGSLHGGRRIWMLAQMPKMVVLDNNGEDKIGSFLLLANAHDSTMSVTIKHTNIRVVCANTLEFSLQEDDALPIIRISHSTSMHSQIEKTKDILRLSEQSLHNVYSIATGLKQRSFTTQKFKKYIEALFPDNPEAKNHTRSQNIRKKIIDLWEGEGRGLNISGVQGTGWAAYNAVAEYLDWIRGRNANNRMEATWFGDNRNIKERALVLANA